MEDQLTSKKKNREKQKSKGVQDFARYSGLVFQMAGIILIAVLGGDKLDKLVGFETPVFTIVLSLLGVFAAIYTAVKEFLK
jgi:F0F1-type ATP synthase assembly protein I